MVSPTATGPSTLAIDGAMPSQLKMRTRSVASRAVTPAVRWMVSMPMFAPVPLSVAARHSSAKWPAPLMKLDSRAAPMPSSVSPTATYTGRW